MGVSASAVARVVGIETIFRNLRGAAAAQLPQRVAVIGQGSTAVTYATTKFTATTAFAVGERFGFGSPVHLMALMLQPVNGDGLGDIPMTIYPLVDDGSGVASAGNILPVGTQVGAAEYVVKINGIAGAPFVIADGDVPAAIGPLVTASISANVNMPMLAVDGVADDTDLTSKWEGTSANDCFIEVEGPSQGVTFTLTQPVGGLVNPNVQPALDLIVDIWETLIASAFEFNDTTILDAYQTFGDGRYGAIVKKPLIISTGYTEATTAAGIAIGDARKDDRINGYITALDSVTLPLQVAARGVVRVARQANDNPPVDYATQILDGIAAGPDSSQLSYADSDASVKAGVSTSRLINGNVALSDTVTFYHPDGEDPPAYRYYVDIVKIQQVIFNLDLIFNSDEWAGAPLIPDAQVTTNEAARSPKDAKAEVNSMIDSLALAAILSDPDAAKLLTTAEINGGNPKRLDVTLTVQISGNTNIISIDFNFGFFFGTPAIAA